MRKILIFLLAFVIIGAASALPLFGPPQGFRNNGAVELGSLTIDGATINAGSISYDALRAEMAANETAINTSIAALTQAAYTNETAINTSIGSVTTARLANKKSDYTNQTVINATAANVAKGQTAQNLTLTNLALAQTWQNTSITNLQAGNAAQNATAANVALGQTAQNNSITNLGLATTAINSSKTANKQSDYINTTAINTTLSKMVYGSGAINATTSISTTLLAASTKTVFPVDASGGHVTLTLPDAATNAGRVYMVVLATDMIANNVIVDTTGAGNLGGTSGADSLTSTDAAAALTVISDGTNYLIINKDGTWS